MRLHNALEIEQALTDHSVDGHLEPMPEADQNLVYIDIVTTEARLGHAAVRNVLASLGMLQGVGIGHEHYNQGGQGHPSLVVESSGATWLTLRDEAAYEKAPYTSVEDHWEEPPF